MIRKNLRICSFLILTLTTVSSLAADPLGTAFSYQGELIDTGQPLTGPYDFRFIFYDAASDGNQAGPTHSIAGVPVVRGRFNAELDFGNVFNGVALWLEIEVRAAGGSTYTVLAPRQKLTPAPAALFSSGSAWAGLVGIPLDFADNVDDDTLAALTCAPGQIVVFNGGWSCGSEVGDIRSVQVEVGSGLTGGATSGNVLLGTDFGTVQKRVTENCPVGEAIRSVGQDGSVICTSPVPLTEVVGDTGWFPAPSRNSITADLGTASYDFVLGLGRVRDAFAGGEIVTPIMGAVSAGHMPAYQGLSSSSATVETSPLGKIEPSVLA